MPKIFFSTIGSNARSHGASDKQSAPPRKLACASLLGWGTPPLSVIREPETQNLKPENRKPKPETRNPETQKPKSETRNQKRNQKPEIKHPETETRNPKIETRDPKPETKKLKPETRNPKQTPRSESRSAQPYGRVCAGPAVSFPGGVPFCIPRGVTAGRVRLGPRVEGTGVPRS